MSPFALAQTMEDHLIGDLILRSSSDLSDASSWYDSADNLSYTLTNAPTPPPPTVPLLADNPRIVLVQVAYGGATSEATTLAFVHEQKPHFETPRVLHDARDDTRSYLFLSRVPGRTLGDAWPTLDETWKHRYVEAVVKTCETLAGWKGDVLGGVDGKSIPEQYLTQRGTVMDFRPEKLTEVCQLMGMDCSTFVFYHADLGPGNIIVEDVPKDGTIGIIDWEIAGYVPRGWIRTKFRLISGLDLPNPGAGEETHWWRSEVQKLLEKRGFEDHSADWASWWY
ncbi:uncharacterized protein N7479_001548 [Penicillium vulpinum]|uniref:Aminoglycoside phosphotransferase domain-containing protein n=1 Tax=Penicillium vulpinum TaxID=29845 RepID=A0A1V6RUJ7_9EURO|nr:uncharacterized protein N7479_001548 [Penicillium vulpinum]KAJ5971630.1 hypothetical protein N7479_001548 [Penicillium vulpinum]OQE05442.1 hypothetical protein PENVUL_c024G05134 [Penicillium vulpinum]